MKLLLENWRRFLIERESDEIYSNVIEFVINAYSTPANFEEISSEEEEADWESISAMFAKIPRVDNSDYKTESKPQLVTHDLMFNEGRIDDIYDQMVQKYPDVRRYLNSSLFYDAFFGLLIKLYYVDTDGNPDSESYAEQKGASTGGYFTEEGDDGGREIGINFGSNFFNPPISYKKFVNLSKQDVFKLLKNNRGMLRMILEHEFTHMLNYVRAGTDKTAKGLKRHHRKKDPKLQQGIDYVNSTEEIQARLVPIFSIVQSAINGETLENSAVSEIAKLISIESKGNKDINNIIKLLFKIYDLNHAKFLEYTSQKNKKRITKRFYEFAQEITNN